MDLFDIDFKEWFLKECDRDNWRSSDKRQRREMRRLKAIGLSPAIVGMYPVLDNP